MTVTEPARTAGSPDLSALMPVRTPSTWASPRGLNTELVPWRLWEKAKKLFWDPAAIDFSVDRQQWASTPVEYQDALLGICTGFMIGEEAVTLDILPLAMAMSDEGRLEEVIFLTSFALEEAKHVDFFRRWLTEIGADLRAHGQRQAAKAQEIGYEFDAERDQGMWESELPRVMRRLLVDRSPQAVLDASITYNQFVEGCLAISGYVIWHDLFAALDAFPAMQEGIRNIRADEGRHITYGTYLCQRILAEHPDLIGFARERMHQLNDLWFDVNPVLENPNDPIGTEQGRKFHASVQDQVVRRIAVMERAAKMTVEELVTSSEAEDAERDLIGAQ